ncbi:acylphosphatase-2 [Psammomys obesus]|uniref:acylphosphatase-2 n=1 Tax=Psammomys obesus TaxID=48139 RepID=UPI0024535779|nr:acylphosphatase-2 [Psammomys obesus]
MGCYKETKMSLNDNQDHKDKTVEEQNGRQGDNKSLFPLQLLTLPSVASPSNRDGGTNLPDSAADEKAPGLGSAVACFGFLRLPTRDPARWCRGALGAGASTQEPPSPRAAAASSPRTPPRMLARRLVAMAGPLKSVDYEVFGRVQGVCFRMYTEGEAKKRGVVGWVKNTRTGTVTGQVQGPEEKVDSMKSWLSKVGSPSSRIDRADFSNEKTISKLEYSDFSIRY